MNDIATRARVDSPLLVEPKRRSPSSRLISLLIVLVCLALLGGLGWYLSHRNQSQGQGQFGGSGRAGRPTATVAFAAATRADIPIRMEALGTVTPIAAATVRAQVSGVLTDIFYTEGQNIERGKPLVRIDPRPFQLALDQSVAALARDEAQLQNAKVILDRNKTLLAQDSIAQQDVDTQDATVKQLQGTVESDRAAVATARLNLSYSTVQAPIGGRVGLRPVDIGNYVTTSDTNGVATITQVMPIDVVFTLPADAVTAVQKRVNAGAELPTTVLDRTRTKNLGAGMFLTLDNQIDTQTGTVRAKARFDNQDGVLFPNEFVNVQLQLDTLHDALVVPANAIRHGPNGDFVYVVDAQNVAHIRLVKLGPSSDDRTAVTDGLQEGEKVVTEGGDRLTDGSTVRLPGQSFRPGAAGGNRRQGQGKRLNGSGTDAGGPNAHSSNRSNATGPTSHGSNPDSSAPRTNDIRPDAATPDANGGGPSATAPNPNGNGPHANGAQRRRHHQPGADNG